MRISPKCYGKVVSMGYDWFNSIEFDTQEQASGVFDTLLRTTYKKHLYKQVGNTIYMTGLFEMREFRKIRAIIRNKARRKSNG